MDKKDKKEIIKQLRENPDAFVGKKIDLKNENLTGEDLSSLNLRGADFFNAKLSGVNFAGADLSEANFFNADLSGAIMSSCILDKANLTGANLSYAQLDLAKANMANMGMTNFSNANLFSAQFQNCGMSKSNFSDADVRCVNFKGSTLREANLRNADFTEANLRGVDMSLSTVSGANFSNADMRSVRLRVIKGFKTARWIGTDLRNINFSGAYLVKRFAFDQNFLKEFKEHSRMNTLLYYLWWITSDCGRSMARWCIWIVIVIIFYAWLYSHVEVDYGKYHTPLSNIYFSIVTLTTLGFGDVIPKSIAGQIIVISEVITGYLMLGGLLSILSNKMARRSE